MYKTYRIEFLKALLKVLDTWQYNIYTCHLNVYILLFPSCIIRALLRIRSRADTVSWQPLICSMQSARCKMKFSVERKQLEHEEKKLQEIN